MDIFCNGLERTETGPPYIFDCFSNERIQLHSERKMKKFFRLQRRTLGSLQHSGEYNETIALLKM